MMVLERAARGGRRRTPSEKWHNSSSLSLLDEEHKMCAMFLSILSCLMVAVYGLNRFSVLMDAGSAGTRVYIYRWSDEDPFATLTEVANNKVPIPVSSLLHDEGQLQDMIDQLTQFAKAHVPAEDVPSTPLCLKGTAGLRRLTLTEQSTLIGRVRNMLRRTGFSVDTSATRVIDGAEEALYDWLAVQVAFAEHPSASLGALDLGGASKQIAYVMKGDSSAPDDNTCSAEWSVRLPSGERPAVRLLAKSVAGLGLIAAMDAVLHDASATAATAEVTEDSAIWRMSHPCLPLGIYPVGSIHHFENVISGSGNFSECAAMVNRLLMPVLHAQIDVQCMQQHRPTVVIGMDGFAKIVHMLGLSSGDHSALTPRHIADAGRIVCSRDWEELLSDFPGFSAYRAQRACFGAAYIYSLLTGAYGLEDDTEGEFWPLEHVGDVEISWALGAVAASTLPEGAIRDLR